MRLIRAGGRVLLVPNVAFRYYARDSLGKLWRMYYQYGYFKPLVVRKVGRLMTARQLIPALFVALLAAAAIAAPWSRAAIWLLAGILLAYAAALTAVAAVAAAKHGVRCAAGLYLVFPTLHFSYGLGYWKGILDFWLLGRTIRGRADAVPLSR